VETLLRKYLGVLDGVVVAICAALVALSVSELVRSRFLNVPDPGSRRSLARAVPAKMMPNKRPDAILRRNIFCSRCPPIRLDGDPEPPVQPDAGAPEEKPTLLPLKLVAVMLAPSHKQKQWNLAVIRDNEQKVFGVFGVGTKVHGATLTAILDTRIYLDNAGTTEFLELLAPPQKASPQPPRTSPPAARPKDPLTQELERGIKKIGDRKYAIQRSTLETVMGNLASLTRSARFVPELRGGKPVGFRILAVRPDGPVASIGLQNGDIVSSLNGLEISSPERSLEAYSKLKSASHLTLALERSGKKVTQDYTIQ
jgi:general secretion pathway protein C